MRVERAIVIYLKAFRCNRIVCLQRITRYKSYYFHLLDEINSSAYVPWIFSDNRACLERSDRILASHGVSWESGGPQVDAADPGSRSSSSTSDTGGRCGRRDSLDRFGVRCLPGRDGLRKRTHLFPVVS